MNHVLAVKEYFIQDDTLYFTLSTPCMLDFVYIINEMDEMIDKGIFKIPINEQGDYTALSLSTLKESTTLMFKVTTEFGDLSFAEAVCLETDKELTLSDDGTIIRVGTKESLETQLDAKEVLTDKKIVHAKINHSILTIETMSRNKNIGIYYLNEKDHYIKLPTIRQENAIELSLKDIPANTASSKLLLVERVLGNKITAKIFLSGEEVYLSYETLRFGLSGVHSVYLEHIETEEKIPLVQDGEFHVLNLLRCSLTKNQLYHFVGYNTETEQKFYIALTESNHRLLESTLVTYEGHSCISTYSYGQFLNTHYKLNRKHCFSVEDFCFKDNKLFLSLTEELTNDSELLIKLRKKNTYHYLELVSIGFAEYVCDFSKINLIDDDGAKEFWDIYIVQTQDETMYQGSLKVIAEHSINSKEIALLQNETNQEKEVIQSGLYLNEQRGFSIMKAEASTYREFMKKKIKGSISIQKITFTQDQLLLEINNSEALKTAELEIAIRETSEKNIVSGVITADQILTFDLSPFLLEFSETPCRFDFKLSYETETSYVEREKMVISKPEKRKEGLVIASLSEEQDLMFYSTSSNLICGVITAPLSALREYYQISTMLKKLEKQSENKYQMKLAVSSAYASLIVERVFIKLRSKEYSMEIPCDIQTNQQGEIDCTLAMDWGKFFPLYWDLFVDVRVDTQLTIPIKVKGASKNILKNVSDDYLKLSLINQEKNEMVYPYVTFSNDISFMIRPKEAYESKQTMWKDRLGYLTYKVFRRFLDRKKIWLSFEKFSSTAQDNGYAFFDYVQKNNLNKNHYYILSENSSDYAEVKATHKNVIKHMSYKYFVYLYASKLLIASETPRHVHNIRIRSGNAAQAIQMKKSVFLQHGVTAFKRSNVFKKSKGRGNFDLVVAVSQQEKEILHENWLYDNDEIAVTGFARWDLLIDKSQAQEKKKIFVMPTWRSWMEDMPEAEFINTDYYQNYMQFLTSPDLEKVIDQYDLEVIFFLHPKFKEYVTTFTGLSDGIKVYGFGDIKVNEKIMESSMMISDYSSVTWDMFYMGKPVTFFQFDYEKYTQYEGSYIDMEMDLFGNRILTVSGLIRDIEKKASENFALEEKYQAMRTDYFDYLDANNCQRIYNEIVKGV